MKRLVNVVLLILPLFCGALPQIEKSESGVDCYKCNSKEIADCAINPAADLPRTHCKNPEDQCIIAVFDGITQRGCEKEVNAPFDAIISTCRDHLCNNKVFPEDRLKCYQCEGKDCIKNFQGTLKPCVYYDAEDYCITDVIDESDVIRGCQSDPDYSVGSFGEMCQESGCNNHSTTYTSECVACSEADSKNCVRMSTPVPSGQLCMVPKDNTCKDTLLLNRPIQCFIYKASNKVVRGCLKEAGKLALDSDNFKTCEGQLCNNECLPLKCLVCDSKTNPKCANMTNELKPQLCSDDTTCFMGQTSEGTIIRGCGSQSTEGSQISTCSTDGCNKNVFPTIENLSILAVLPTPPSNQSINQLTAKTLECYKCNSNNLVECANNPSPNLPRDYCKDANDQCVTAIIDGVTYRGCEKELNVPANSISGACNSNLCNVEHFKVPHSGLISKENGASKTTNNNNFSNNNNNNTNSNNNNKNNIFVQIINGNNKNHTSGTI